VPRGHHREQLLSPHSNGSLFIFTEKQTRNRTVTVSDLFSSRKKENNPKGGMGGRHAATTQGF